MATFVVNCPTCKCEVGPRPENAFFPFCSDRCKVIDLGRWLGGDYRIAASSEDEDDDGDASPPVSSADS